jgi:hypothetical protein
MDLAPAVILKTSVPPDPAVAHATFECGGRHAQLRYPLPAPSGHIPQRFTDFGNCSITPGNSAWIAERAGFRRYDFVDNAQHFQVILTKVGIQIFFFGVRLPSVIEQLRPQE